ncbi:MAG: DUF2127 domain-containing protein [Acidobacteriota bacterium]|nr:DUF2127 domain-containing protein [Acidobacteriota bacterium]
MLDSGTITAARPRSARRHSHRAGLRTVAFLEALKGVLALLAAYLLTSMIRHDVDFEGAAENVLFFLHIDPDRHMSQEFLNMADKLSDVNVVWILVIATAYAVVRFAEGYGLWRQRVWAEWLAIISGCIYLPIEIYKLVQRPNGSHWAILFINILVVLYIGWVRWDEIKSASQQQVSAPSPAD